MLFSETLSMNNIMKHSELGHKNQSTYAEDRNSESVLVSAMIWIFQKEKIITEISSNGCWAISYIFPTHNRIRSANYPMMPRNAIFLPYWHVSKTKIWRYNQNGRIKNSL